MKLYLYTIVVFTNAVSKTLMSHLKFVKITDGYEFSTENLAEANVIVNILNELRYEWLVEIRPAGRTWGVAEIEQGIDNYDEWTEHYCQTR